MKQVNYEILHEGEYVCLEKAARDTPEVLEATNYVPRLIKPYHIWSVIDYVV